MKPETTHALRWPGGYSIIFRVDPSRPYVHVRYDRKDKKSGDVYVLWMTDDSDNVCLKGDEEEELTTELARMVWDKLVYLGWKTEVDDQ